MVFSCHFSEISEPLLDLPTSVGYNFFYYPFRLRIKMSNKDSNEVAKLEQGRELARRLYDIKLGQLEKTNQQEQNAYLKDYPLLSLVEFNDVLRQVIEAKKAQQIQVGWFTIPHDVTVPVFVLATWLVDLRTGILAAVAILVLFESFFQAYFNPRIYPKLSLLVWLTYPAYILLGWVLYSRGFEWYWIVLAVAGAWGGIFLAGIIARIPMQLIMKARIEGAKPKASQVPEQK
jgi:hypothetical protein